MKKIVLITCLALLIASLFVGCSQKKEQSTAIASISTSSKTINAANVNQLADTEYNITIQDLQNLAKNGVMAIWNNYQMGSDYQISKILYGITTQGVCVLNINIEENTGAGLTNEYVFGIVNDAYYFAGSSFSLTYQVAYGLNSQMIVYQQPAYNEQGDLNVNDIISMIKKDPTPAQIPQSNVVTYDYRGTDTERATSSSDNIARDPTN